MVKKQVVPLTTNAKLAVIRWKQESESEGGAKLTWREIGARLVQEGFCPVEPEKSTMSKIFKVRRQLTPCGAESTPCWADIIPCGTDIIPCGTDIIPCVTEIIPRGLK